ncbi:MAG: nitroreductase family protein [Treponema sp.]|nr:nitroreductase family protein [Treponema sp.]
MKKMIIAVLMIAVFCVLTLPAQDASARAGVMLSHYATRNFITGAIPQADLNAIVQAAVRAPSASNRQPWFFTVVQNFELAKKIVPQTVEGNALIIISAENAATREIIDCALATQNIYLAAQALGYGSRIYTGPIENLNRTLKTELGLPASRNAVALVRIGRIEGNVDAASAASPRKAAAETVTYK